jgi:Tfp pilus assembly protein PilW
MGYAHMKRAGYSIINHHGTTLVEVMLYMAIAISVLTIVSFMFVGILQARVKNQSILEVEEQGYQAMQYMTQVIRNSEGINNISAGESAIMLEVNTLDDAVDPTILSLSSDTLQMTEGGGDAIDLHNSQVKTTEVIFKNLTSNNFPLIRIELTLERNNPTGRNEYEYSQTFYGSALIKEE